MTSASARAGSEVGTRPLAGLSVLHLGHFDPNYARNRIMAKALRRAGATVHRASALGPYARRTPRLAWDVLRRRSDVILVGFPGHADTGVARLGGLLRRTPVVLDAFVSLYETEEDRRQVTGISGRRSRALVFEDRLACRLADLVVLDTNAHADFFAERLGVDRGRLRRIWVGADEDVMKPGPQPAADLFRVFLYASFIPLHGLEHVVRAARILQDRSEDVRIDIVGGGPTAVDIRALAAEVGATNVFFQGKRPFRQLPDLMAASHLCLGIFGTSAKAQRVIPNKVFDALAAARPVLTADSPAIREALTDGETVRLCPPGDPDALADAIVSLKNDEPLRRRLADQGHRLFLDQFSVSAISNDVAAVVLDAIG